MRICRVLLTIFFSLGLSGVVNAASHLTVEDARTLLGNLHQEEVSLCEGCCSCFDNDCCEGEKLCGAKGNCGKGLCVLNTVNGGVGLGSGISAIATTPSAYPCCGECCVGCCCTKVFNAALFKAGMVLWGAFGTAIVSPFLIIPGVNYIRNLIIRSSNEDVEKKTSKLPKALDPNVRLDEYQILHLGEIILGAEPEILKKLDVDQALTLALVDLELFKKFVDQQAFAKAPNFIAIGLIDVLSKSEAEQRRAVNNETALKLFDQYPMFYVVLKKLLPAVMFPIIELPNFFNQFFSGNKIPKKHKASKNYEFIEDFSEKGDEVLIDLDCKILMPVEPEIKSPITLLIDGQKIIASKPALTSISTVFENMINDLGQEVLEIPITLPNITVDDIETLVYLSTLSTIKRSYLVNEHNIEHFLKLHSIFDIKFLNELCDIYCKTNSGFRKTDYQRLEYATNNHLGETKKLLIKDLSKKLHTFVFDPEDIQSIALLDASEQEDLFTNFEWDKLYVAFQQNSELIKTLWDHATKYKIQKILDQLILYSQNEENAYNVIAKAWGIFVVPKELQPDFSVDVI